MTKITQSKSSIGTYSGILAVVVSLGFASQVFAYTPITSSLDLGDKNSDVTSLQAFFADNSSVYPEGLVTGYFGGLTQSAVERFQAQQGIVSSGSAASTWYGRVGPSTKNAINLLINGGGWTAVDISGPSFSAASQTVTNISATFVWNTNELATGKIFYSTSPVSMNEGDSNSAGFSSTNGLVATNDNLARTSQQVALTNLQPNTVYYYTLVATDLKGNVSVVGPNNTFRTNAY